MFAVSAVHDGYVLNASIMRSPVGGALMNECMLASLTEKGSIIHPRYMHKRIMKPGISTKSEGLETLLGDSILASPAISKSHITWATHQIVGDIKETLCRCALSFPLHPALNRAGDASLECLCPQVS